MPLTRFLVVLRRNIWRILFAAVVCAGTTAVFLQDLPKRYKATAQVVIDINGSTSGDGADLSPFIIDKYIATQVDIMSSQAVALRVVDSLGLAIAPPERAAVAQVDANGDADAAAAAAPPADLKARRGAIEI